MATAIRCFETALAVTLGAGVIAGMIDPAVGASLANQTLSSQTFVASHPPLTQTPLRPQNQQATVGVTPTPNPSLPAAQAQAPVGPTPPASPTQPPGSGSSNSGMPVGNAVPGTIRGPSEETGGASAGGSLIAGASPDASRGANGPTACAAPDRGASCGPGEAPEYVVTATVAQAGDVSAGTYVFGTNADGSPRVILATPVTPGTLGAAGLDRLVGRGSASQPMVTGALSEVASASGAKTMAVDLSGDKLLSFAVGKDSVGNITDGNGKALAQGSETAAGRPVVMGAAAAEHVVQSAINLAGVHQANGYLIRDGKLVLVYLEPGQHVAQAPKSVAAATQIATPAN